MQGRYGKCRAGYGRIYPSDFIPCSRIGYYIWVVAGGTLPILQIHGDYSLPSDSVVRDGGGEGKCWLE